MSKTSRRSVPELTEEVQDRFWDKVKFPEEDDTSCWTWQAAVRGSDKMGVFGIEGRVFYVHRIAYTLAFGIIPERFDVHRCCNNSLCVRPRHLKLVPTEFASKSQ